MRRFARPWVMITDPRTPGGRAAHLLVVEDVPDPGDPGSQQEIREAAPQRSPELVPEQVEDEGREALEELDDDVARDRVGDDDIGQVACHVLALDVADEAQPRGVEELGRPLDPEIALALLLADREEGHPRVADADDALGEDRPHPGVLGEVLGRRIGVRPDVEQDERRSGPDHLDGQGRAVDAGQPTDPEDRRSHRGAGVAGRDHGVGLAAADELAGDEDRGVLLLPQRERRVLVHLDDLAGRDDRDVRRQLTGRRPDRGLGADEEDMVLGMRTGVVEGPGHDLYRPVITPHRVNG
jgi:hypothetical protein